ncbi:MAG: PepSY domain-containing protein [Alphaproteobacteria bacterium]|nr:PepSY domain-containing protein [Alphaproteobacteria bacterium]
MRRMRTLHRWLGLLLAAPVVVQGLTGAILALVPVFVPAFSPSADPATNTPLHSINRIVAAAHAASPEGMRPGRYIPPEGNTPATVILVPRSGPARGAGVALRIEPTTLAVLSTEPANAGLLGWVRRLHTSFLLEDRGGRQINGWIGLGLLAVAVLGVVVWWPRPGQWRAAFSIECAARGWRFQRRLHGAAGGWTALMLLVSAATGAALAFPQTTRTALGIAPSLPMQVTRPSDPAVPPDLDKAVSVALEAVPGVRLRGILLPARPAEAIRVLLGPPNTEGVVSLATVAVDPWAARVVQLQSPNTQSVGERVLRWTHDLHQAVGLGPVWRAMTVAAGIAVPLFAVTGWWMWLLRRRNRRRIAHARTAAVNSGA